MYQILLFLSKFLTALVFTKWLALHQGNVVYAKKNKLKIVKFLKKKIRTGIKMLQ